MNSVLWVTNIPTPYAVGLWRHLNAMTNLQILCHAATEDNRHWTVNTEGLRIQFLNLRQIRMGYERRIYLGSFKVGLSTVRSRDAIFLDGWDSLVALQILVLAKICRKPAILSYWSTTHTHQHRRGPIATYRRLFMRCCDAVLTPGCLATDAARGILAGSNVLVRQGNASVDLDHWGLARKLRESISDTTGHTFVYVGQLIGRKNLELLITAFNQLGNDADRLTIVGDGPEKEKLSRLGASYDRVTFLGDLQGDHLLAAYADADTLVLPSIEEVWGLVVLEALAAGLHVVISDVCGAAGDIDHYESVFVFSSGSLSDLVRAMTSSRDQWTGPTNEDLRPPFEPCQMAQTILLVADELHQQQLLESPTA